MCSAKLTGLLTLVERPAESAGFQDVLLGVYVCVDQAVLRKLAAHTSWLRGKVAEVGRAVPLPEAGGLTGLMEPLPNACMPLLIPNGTCGLKDPVLPIGPGIGSPKDFGSP